MKHGGQSAILDQGAREGVKEEMTFEQRLKVVREQECMRLGKEHFRKYKGSQAAVGVACKGHKDFRMPAEVD